MEQTVQGAQVWIVAAHTSHALRWQHDTPLTMLFVEKKFAHESVGQAIKGAALLSLKVVGTHDVKIPQWLEEFERIEEPARVAGDIYIKSIGTLLAVHLFWVLERALMGSANSATSLSLAIFQRIERMIEKRMDEKISLWDMAKEACMSANNFLRLFKRRIGISPRQYLIQQRLRRGAQLLRAEELNISEIAQQVGFSSQAHFDESFRKLMQCTPTQYRTGYLKGAIPTALGDIPKA
jgi:AraC family transcriptional regulator